jgi:tetratricopeptide (TPR) repeat protein
MEVGGSSPIRSLADDIAALGLDRYLLDTAVIDQAASDLTVWLRQETGVPVPGAVVRLGCRVVSAALFDRLKCGADRAISGGLAVAVRVFEGLPGADRFCAALRDWARTKAADANAMAQLEALLAGDRREIDPKLLQTLSTDLRFQLQQVGKLDGVRDQLTVGFAELLERLNPQPQLDPKLRALDESSRLYFGARKVPFVGREAELRRLLDVTLADGDVSWWLVTGPGGMGKSRLALELCHRAGACWRTGFLPQQQLEHFNWTGWQPDLPHLMIVDYAAALPKAVGRLLEALRLRQYNTPLEMPVRVLLLERRKDDRWWDELMAAGDRHGLAEILVDQTPLELGPLGPDGIWSMVAAIGGHAAETLGRDSVLERLTAIDPAMRPLFTALAGEALAAGADLRQWTRTDLLDDWLKRERARHWQPAGVDEPHANLAALATMVGGIAEDILATPPDGIELPRPEAISATAYAAITGREPVADDNDMTWFAALEPDLLGTFFVLQHMRAPMGENTAMLSVVKNRADTYRRTAWNRDDLDALDAFTSFLDRSKDDFLGHPVFATLLGPPVGSELSRTLWAVLVVDLIDAMDSAGQLDEAKALLAQLKILADDHPDESELRLRVAQGSFNLVNDLGSAGRIDEAEALLAQLKTLADDHPDEPQLRLERAKVSANLINDVGSAGRTDEAEALLAQLKILSDDHPDEPELRVPFARGSVNLINAMVSAGRIDEAEALLAQFKTRTEDHPDDLPVIAAGGIAAFRVLVAYVQCGNTEGAKATARSAEGLLRHPTVIVRLRQRLGEDVAGQIEDLIEALLSDD